MYNIRVVQKYLFHETKHLHVTSIDGAELEKAREELAKEMGKHRGTVVDNDKKSSGQSESIFTIVGPSPDLGDFDTCEAHIEVRRWEELLKRLSELKHTVKKPLWIDMSCDRETFELIASRIRPKIHPLTIEDCTSKDCREKLESFRHYLFMCIRAPTHNRDITQRIAVIVFKSVLLTYHDQPAIIIDDIRKIIKRRHLAGLTPKWNCPSPAWVCHALVDGVIDALIPEVNRVVTEVENLEKLVPMLGVHSQHELLQRFQNGRAALGIYRHRLWPKSILVDHLNNLEWRAFLRDVPAPYWRDINDHLSRMVEIIEIGIQTLESLQNVFVAKVSANITTHSNRLNEIGAKLAATTAVFLPSSFLTSLLGMNCWAPFQLSPPYTIAPERAKLGFIIMVSIMVTLSFSVYLIVMKKGWTRQAKKQW